MKDMKGVYALVLMTENKLIGVRDPHGMRPLALAKKGDMYMLSSENCAFDALDAEFVRDLEPGEIIAFYSNGVVVTHRVVENHYFYDELITKGDANEANDIKPVPYRELIGRVRFHMPLVGNYLMFYAGSIGKLYLLGLAFCGVLFNILAGRIRVRHEEQFREQLARYEKSQAARLKAEMEEVSR